MNTPQKYAICGLIGAIIWTAANAPWEKKIELEGTVYQVLETNSPLWESPQQEQLQQVKLKSDVLLMEWLGCGVVFVLAWGLCGAMKTPPPKQVVPRPRDPNRP